MNDFEKVVNLELQTTNTYKERASEEMASSGEEAIFSVTSSFYGSTTAASNENSLQSPSSSVPRRKYKRALKNLKRLNSIWEVDLAAPFYAFR